MHGTRLKLGPVEVVTPGRLAPGELDGDLVGTGGGDVRLGQVKPEGKGWMPAAAWRNGARLAPGERLGT